MGSNGGMSLDIIPNQRSSNRSCYCFHSVYKVERGVFMSTQELIQKHLEEKCKNCTNKNCNGISITRDKIGTRCNAYEK